MIAQIDDLHGVDVAAVEAALSQEPLASAAEHTVASFLSVTQTLTDVGELAVEYGDGKPLAIFQSLLTSYQTLAAAQASLAETATKILAAAERLAAAES